MISNLPQSHLQDALELESRGLRDFFKVELKNAANTVLYLTPHNTAEFLDQTWESIPCKLSDVAQNSTGEQNRPKFSIVNPGGVFSLWVEKGVLEGGSISRYRVLLPDLKAQLRSYSKHVWVISKVVSLNKDLLVLELRSPLDGPNFQIPSRTFFPPAFPHVSLR